jgi:uncharacterized membrane protein YdjX (TVP38/TMEM64 family)
MNVGPASRNILSRRLSILVVALGVAALVASSDSAHSLASDAVALGEGLIRRYPGWGMPVFLILSAASAMLAFFSSMILVPVAVSAWGEWVTCVLLWGGWMLGGALSFCVGRYLGRRVVGWFVSPERLDYFQTRLRAQAGFPIILLFQLAVPSEIPGYVLGTMRCRLGVYLLALALAELPYAVGGVFLAGSFLERRYIVLLVLGLALIALVAWAFRRLRLTFDAHGST